jgi:RecJ-like exonuclease
MEPAGRKIFCPHCRQESAVKVIKKYDGFTPVGEIKTCAFCGYEFLEEEPALIEAETPEWARQEGIRKVCYRCRHYVLNPFVQKCVLQDKEVDALDSCPRFSPRPSPPKAPPTPESKPPPIF